MMMVAVIVDFMELNGVVAVNTGVHVAACDA